MHSAQVTILLCALLGSALSPLIRAAPLTMTLDNGGHPIVADVFDVSTLVTETIESVISQAGSDCQDYYACLLSQGAATTYTTTYMKAVPTTVTLSVL